MLNRMFNAESAMQIEVKKIGNSVGLILPAKLVAAQRLEVGDVLTVTETPDGLTLSRRDASFENDLERARALIKKHRNSLVALADV